MIDLSVKDSPMRGRGMFARQDYVPNQTISQCSVTPISIAHGDMVEKTPIGDYLFWWDEHRVAIAFGPISFANHSAQPNMYLARDYEKNTLASFARRPIAKGEELTFDYETIWFPVME